MAGTASDPSSIDQAGLIYAWDFGDGQQGSGPLVSYSYIQPGNYTVELTVTDKNGAQGSDTATVQVMAVNQPPSAVIGGPTHGLVGETLNFSGGGSQDDGLIMGYTWDFEDGTKAEGMTVGHVYDLPGDYRVKLTVTDDDGLTGTASLGIHIVPPPPVNQPPKAVISGPAQGLMGETLGFSGSDSSDSDGTIVSYEWLFGDGTSTDGANVNHSYGTPGSYQVRLTVTDNNESTAQAMHTVQVNEPAPINQPPTAVISGSVTAAAGQIVQFDGSGSSSSDGSIVSYAWDFGDGNTGSGITVTHVYTQAGNYTVALTVTDNGGLIASAAFVIQIEPAAAAAKEEWLPL
jgi:PKD repeat protein